MSSDAIGLSIFGILFAALAVAGFTATVAREKGYSVGAWFLGGFFFNVIALIAVAGLPIKDAKPAAAKPERDPEVQAYMDEQKAKMQ